VTSDLPAVGALVRHVDTGIDGADERVFAAGEHPTATCEALRPPAR
jgi:hypothetical protein